MKIEQIIVGAYTNKIQNRPYLLNSPPVSIFSDAAVVSSEKLEQFLAQYLKAYEQEYMTSGEGVRNLLELYKEIFGHLSGLEINYEINHYVEEVFPEKIKHEMQSLTRMRQATDRSIVNFISHKSKM